MEKNEATIAAERASVEAMKNAKSNMTNVLARVETLERSLSSAMSTISTLKGYIAPNVYTYPVSGSSKKCTEIADAAIADIAKVLS